MIIGGNNAVKNAFRFIFAPKEYIRIMIRDSVQVRIDGHGEVDNRLFLKKSSTTSFFDAISAEKLEKSMDNGVVFRYRKKFCGIFFTVLKKYMSKHK